MDRGMDKKMGEWIEGWMDGQRKGQNDEYGLMNDRGMNEWMYMYVL